MEQSPKKLHLFLICTGPVLAVFIAYEPLRLKPDYYDAHYNMALAMTRLGRYDDAVERLNIALAAKPDWPEAYYNLARAYYRQGL